MKRMPYWSQKIEARIFQRIFALGIFGGRVSRYAATPLIVVLSPGHNDITRFRPWLSIATGNHSDRDEKISNIVQTTGTVVFLIRLQAFRDPLGRELPHIQIFMNDGLNPFTWDAQLLSYWFSRNPAGGLPRLARGFYQYSPGWSLFWVVQDEAHHRWKNHHVYTGPPSFWRWHTMVHVPLMFLSEWRKFPSAPCLAGKKNLDDSSRLDVVEIARVAWYPSFQPL